MQCNKKVTVTEKKKKKKYDRKKLHHPLGLGQVLCFVTLNHCGCNKELALITLTLFHASEKYKYESNDY